ncbi:Tox-REase-5 domain-containing protein [Janibacter anophelis]|uniref:Tox-REase-5 domain-containing protein n=1 Tax=Janibacter anophelis TaxID=319054 RepID=UPI000DEFD2F5|nr:Tox-REase-5 domain-containing protein [Janibacter anophelis]
MESWAGPDTQAYAADWQSVLPALTSAAERLTTLARLLVEQADEQDAGSGRGEGPDPGGLGSPLGRRPDGTGLDPRQALAGLSLPGLPSGSTLRDWRDRGIKMGIRNAVPTMPGLGPLLEISYERWQQTELTWFEGLFVPWLWPQKWRNTYFDVVDDGTDWANDVYKDHVRDLPGFRDARWAAHKAGDVVELIDPYVTRYGPPGSGFGWGMFKDTVNETTEILDDPKGWWDQASGLDQLGVAASVVPAAGWAGKGVVMTTKRLLKGVVNDSDLLRKLADDRGSIPVDFGFGKDNPRPGDYPEWVVYSKKPSSAHPLPEDFEPGWAATKPGGERGMDYQEQVTGIERLPDGRVPEYIVRDPATDHPVAFDGHESASGSTPEKFTDAKDGYTSLVTDPGTPWADGMTDSLLEQAERQSSAVPDGAVLEWSVSDPDSARAIRKLLNNEGYTNIDVVYVPKER